MPTYHVIIHRKATPSQPEFSLTLAYTADDYTSAWVGARTVCRLGTLFHDDPKCKKAALAREFFDLVGERVSVAPAVWTVERIYVDGTRKTGKQRMTTLSAERLLGILEEQGVPFDPALAAALQELLPETGLRVTVASARQLGVDTPNLVPPRRRGQQE